MSTIISCFEVTLIYADGTTWFAGGFPSQEAADAWIANEKNQKYWLPTTEVRIDDKSYTLPSPN